MVRLSYNKASLQKTSCSSGDTFKGLVIMATLSVTTATAFVPTAALLEARQGALSAAQGLGGAERSAYGANRIYAAALNDAFGFAWFTFRDAVELKKASPEFVGEKDAFYKAYRAVRDISNMSAIWAQIKGYGDRKSVV